MAAIRIKLGDENRIFIESNVLKSPLFAEQYAQLIKKISEYVRVEKEEGVSNSRNYNNLFLINGERGAGKSSMLASMHEYLEKKDAVENKKFLRLKVIDPSSFTNNANILQIIIAELFKEFKKDTQERQISYEEKNEITKIFVQIKHALCVLDFPKTQSPLDDSDIESLVDLSNAIVLEELIGELIRKILKARGVDLLLVCVDDIDLNTAHAYEMLEQIRKYLILPNVIVLIAAKMNQLQEVVQQHFLGDYKELVSKEVLKNQDVLEMSNKYLLKLLPLEHRIELDTTILKFKQPIEITNGSKVVVSANSGAELIYKLIYQKTGLQYLLERDGANYIVPDNLRAFRFLVRLLCDMDAERKNRNIEAYQQYFLSEWVPQNLQLDEQQNIKEILNDSDVSKVNKQIIRNIAEKIKDIGPSREISLLLDNANVYSNVSLGDVMAVIVWSKSINSSEKFARYIYAFKHIYTMLLEKTYREMLVETEMQKKIDMYDDPAEEYINAYQRLVGGALLNSYTWDYLLPVYNNTENRLHRAITLNPQSIGTTPNIIRYIAVTPSRPKAVNEGEAYRKQIPIYYLQSLNGISNVIIDWFNILYSIPFYAEQSVRYKDEAAKEEMRGALRDANQAELVICKKYFGMAIHSVDILERIYWHIRSKRNYLRVTQNKLDIYIKFLKTLGDVSLEKYIDKQEDANVLMNIATIATAMLVDGKEQIIQILEENHSGKLPTLGLPEINTIKKFQTVADVKARMRYININKGYKAEWIDQEVDKLGLTDEDLQTKTPHEIRNLLKRMGK